MIIPYTLLSSDTLRGIVEEFVLREGTDYGYGTAVGSESGRGQGLEGKVAQVMRQLETGDVAVVYDEETESCDLVTRGSKRFLAASVAKAKDGED